AIWGDASDNIPGVPGIGEKGACKLVGEWGAVENILANVQNIKGKQGEKIAAWGDNLLLSKRLTTICTEVPVEFNAADLEICEPDYEELRYLYQELDFTSLLRELPAAASVAQSIVPAEQPAAAKPAERKAKGMECQGDLFAALMPEPAPAVAVTPVAEPSAEPTEDNAFATAQTTPHTYHLVRTLPELEALVARLSSVKEFCFDTETTGFDMFRDRIVGMSFAVEAHEAWYVDFSVENTPAFAEAVRPLFENEAITKVAQNIKFDMMVLSRLGIEVRGEKIDTMILHYLLDAESRHNMNFLAERYLHYTPIAIESLIGKGARQLTMDQVNIEAVKEYAAEDADITMQLKQVLWAEVEQQGLVELYRKVEEPMIDVLAAMELAGVKIDAGQLAEYGVELNAELQRLEDEIRREADEPMLNVNSARQLGEVLFGKMRITDKPKMTKTKQYSTDEEYLQTFAGKHPIVDNILTYRGVKKLLSTYVEALPQLINPVTGRIHTSYNQAVTATGRLSSTNPNLQNIPVRDDMGRRIREAFVPSDSDHVLLSADYSQVELRLMAHLSGDEQLVDAFRQGADIHSATAAKLYH
ncbi:MAG: DNA polymerase I, partial [Alistipes sp.]|nr:DNA polymerase I [Alistipes sp.]